MRLFKRDMNILRLDQDLQLRDEVNYLCILSSFLLEINDLLKYFLCTITQSSDVVGEELASWLNDSNEHSEVLPMWKYNCIN